MRKGAVEKELSLRLGKPSVLLFLGLGLRKLRALLDSAQWDFDSGLSPTVGVFFCLVLFD